VAMRRVIPMSEESINNSRSSNPEDQQTLEAFAALFRGRTDARVGDQYHGKYNADE